MTDRDIERIAEVFKGVMEETFGVDCKTHAEHHGFIARIRKRIEYAVRAAIWTLSASAALAVGYAILEMVRNGG